MPNDEQKTPDGTTEPDNGTVPTPPAPVIDEAMRVHMLEKYKVHLTERLQIGGMKNNLSAKLQKLHERNLVVEGMLMSFENEYGFDRKSIGEEIIASLQKQNPQGTEAAAPATES